MFKFLKWAALSFVGIILFFVVLGQLGVGQPPQTDLKTCLARGQVYYIEIGSYPKLSDGRSAKAVIAEKCGRSLMAFN